MAYKFMRKTFGYLDALQTLHRGGVSAPHACSVGNLHEKFATFPETPLRATVARFQQGVIHRGVDMAADQEEALNSDSVCSRIRALEKTRRAAL